MIILYFLLCFIATGMGAVSGIGGGVIIKPVMDAVSGLSVGSISFLSGCTVLAMSIVSLLRSRGSNIKIEFKTSTSLAAGAAAGGILGKNLFSFANALFANENIVGAVQSGILVLITLFVFVFCINKQKINTLKLNSVVLSVFIGLLLGLVSAFLGIGGGPLNIAVLTYFFSMDTKTCSLNSIYVILFSQIFSLLSTFVFGSVPSFNPVMLSLMMAGGILGGFCGSAILKKFSEKNVNTLFYVMMLIITLISGYNMINFIF